MIDNIIIWCLQSCKVIRRKERQSRSEAILLMINDQIVFRITVEFIPMIIDLKEKSFNSAINALWIV